MTQVVIYGQSSTLRHVPPARVTSATYAIEDLTKADDAADRVIASGEVTYAGWSITTSAISGPTQSNPRRMSTAATTTVAVGDPAAIVAANGATEMFKVATVSSNAYVEAETALAGVYASSSTVYGIVLSATVPSSLYNDEDILEQRRTLRVVWSYTLGGVSIKAQDRIDFVRHTTAATIDIGRAILRVRELYPDLPGRLPDHASLDKIARTLAEKIDDDLRERTIRPEQLLAGPAGLELLELRILSHAGEFGYAPGKSDPATWQPAKAAEYRQRLESLTIGEPGEGTTETDFVSDTAPETPSHKYRGPTLRL